MKKLNWRGLGLLSVFALAAAGCADGSSLTETGDSLMPQLPASVADGLTHPNPLFRSIGPRFSMNAVQTAPAGMLTAAADANGGTVYAARRTSTLGADEVRVVEVDPEDGATIRLPNAGMRLIIPAGALPGDDEIDITVHAYAGKYHVYEFLPHGIQFNEGIRVEFDVVNVEAFGESLKVRLKELTQYQADYAKCEAMKATGQSTEYCQKLAFMWADYTEDANWYKAAVSSDGFVGVYFTGNVLGDSELQALEIFDVSLDGDELVFYTKHFSGYALGM